MNRITIIYCLIGLIAFGQPVVEWQRTYGGTGSEYGYSIMVTSDGGFLTAGYTTSNNGDVTGNQGSNDYWVVKSDALGTIEWQQTYGGSGDDQLYAIKQTADGGYIATGFSTSNDGDVSGNHGGTDYWVIKLSSTGLLEWQKCFGGFGEDKAFDVQQTADGGYIVVGESSSNDSYVTGNHGGTDFWIIKLDQVGTMQWQRSAGGTSSDNASGVKQTSDLGYVVVGSTFSENGDVSGFHTGTGTDVWVVRLDYNGNLVWQKCLGGSSIEQGYSITETQDGGYALCGYAQSDDGDVVGNHGFADCWVVKLDANSNIQWQGCFGGTGFDSGAEMHELADFSFIVAAQSNSADGDLSQNLGSSDLWVMNIDQNGGLIWQKSLGGDYWEYAYNITPTDYGYLAVGFTGSATGDVCSNQGSDDLWVVKLNDCSVVIPSSSQEICSVGLDSLTNKNRIVWEKPLDVGIDSFYVYKEIATGVYSKIGAVDNCANGVFIDLNSTPQNSSYKYKIAVLGMCGDTSTLSTVVHETVNLIVTPGAGGVFDLSWNPYVGFPYTTYNLYRGSDSSNISLLTTLPSSATSFQDNTPPAGALLYQIEVVNPNDCDPTKINGYGVSRSNIANNGIAALNTLESTWISIYPNPTKGNITLEVGEGLIGKPYNLMDGFGRILFSGTIQTAKQPLEMNGLSKGTYFLNIESTGSVQRLIKW